MQVLLSPQSRCWETESGVRLWRIHIENTQYKMLADRHIYLEEVESGKHFLYMQVYEMVYTHVFLVTVTNFYLKKEESSVLPQTFLSVHVV